MSLLQTITGSPLLCVMEEVTNGAPEIAQVGHLFHLPTKEVECWSSLHFLISVPMILHNTVTIELLTSSWAEEPDFVLRRDLIGCTIASSSTAPLASPFTPSANTAALGTAVETGAGGNNVRANVWKCDEDYSWLETSRKPHWDPTDPLRLFHFVKWIQESYRNYQRTVFEERVLPINERLQFEYASCLQGFPPNRMKYYCARNDPAGSWIVTLCVPLFSEKTEAAKLRQLLFRMGTSVMQFQSTKERMSVLDCLEDFEATQAPVQISFCCVLIVLDDQPGSFRVSSEFLSLRVVGDGIETPEELRKAGIKNPKLDLPAMHRLASQMETLIPLHETQFLPKLSAGGPGSFIDVLPQIEEYLMLHWAEELYHWLDLIQCLAEEFGAPHLWESRCCRLIPSCAVQQLQRFGGSERSGQRLDFSEFESVQRFAQFAVTDDLTGLTVGIHVDYHGRFRLPVVTVASAQYCLQRDGNPIRIQCTYDESSVMRMDNKHKKMKVDAVCFADQTRLYLEKIFPKFVQVCETHSKQ